MNPKCSNTTYLKEGGGSSNLLLTVSLALTFPSLLLLVFEYSALIGSREILICSQDVLWIWMYNVHVDLSAVQKICFGNYRKMLRLTCAYWTVGAYRMAREATVYHCIPNKYTPLLYILNRRYERWKEMQWELYRRWAITRRFSEMSYIAEIRDRVKRNIGDIESDVYGWERYDKIRCNLDEIR